MKRFFIPEGAEPTLQELALMSFVERREAYLHTVRYSSEGKFTFYKLRTE